MLKIREFVHHKTKTSLRTDRLAFLNKYLLYNKKVVVYLYKKETFLLKIRLYTASLLTNTKKVGKGTAKNAGVGSGICKRSEQKSSFLFCTSDKLSPDSICTFNDGLKI